MSARSASSTLAATPVARWLPLGLVAGPVLFTVAWLVLGFVSPGYTAWGAYIPYSPIHQGVSGLGLGPTGPFMNAAFLANGVLTAAGVVDVFRAIPELSRRARWICAALLMLPALGSVTDGVFTLDAFLLHNLGFGLVLTTVVSFPVTGVLLRRVPSWRGFGTWLIAGGPLTLALTAAFFMTFTPTIAGAETGIAGLMERLLILEVQAWYVALGWLAFRNQGETK